jgi:hypothetical protein
MLLPWAIPSQSWPTRPTLALREQRCGRGLGRMACEYRRWVTARSAASTSIPDARRSVGAAHSEQQRQSCQPYSAKANGTLFAVTSLPSKPQE